MEPIRIAHIMGNMGSGGVEAVVMNYYRHIDRTQFQFDFIVDENSTLPQKEEITKLGGRIFYVPPYKKVFKYIKHIKQICRDNQYTIVHSHITTMSIFPLYAAKKAGVPVRIAHSHSTAGKGEWKRNIMKYTLRPFSKVYANAYFACGEYAGRWLYGNHTFDQGKVTVINNAIDIHKFQYNIDIRSSMRKKWGLEDRFVIGHIGRFVTQKNHTYLIDTFKNIHDKNKNATLLLLGDGPLLESIQKKVHDLKLEKEVIFAGVHKNANEFYQAMDVFVLPSLYEGLPVVGIEAQASGLPCILSSAMTKETKILKTSSFKHLEEGTEEWADTILSVKTGDRDVSEEVRSAHFEIHEEAQRLENKYHDYIEKM